MKLKSVPLAGLVSLDAVKLLPSGSVSFTNTPNPATTVIVISSFVLYASSRVSGASLTGVTVIVTKPVSDVVPSLTVNSKLSDSVSEPL